MSAARGADTREAQKPPEDGDKAAARKFAKKPERRARIFPKAKTLTLYGKPVEAA